MRQDDATDMAFELPPHGTAAVVDDAAVAAVIAIVGEEYAVNIWLALLLPLISRAFPDGLLNNNE